MILDKLGQVMASYAPTDHTSAVLFQSYIDRLAAMDDGAGADMAAYVNIAVAPTSGGTTNLTFDLIGNASDNTFASGNVVLASSGAIAKATLVVGRQIRMKAKRIDITSAELKTSFLRYVTILLTISGSNDLTAGTFNAWVLNAAFQDNIAYPANYTV